MARKKAKSKAKRPAAKKSAKKSKRVAAVPKGFHTLTPYMTVERRNDALQFYQEAFGAKLLYTLSEPGGRIGHAEMRIGDSIFMLADPFPDWGVFAPQPGDKMTFRLHLSVKDVDAFVARAVKAGAKIVILSHFGRPDGKRSEKYSLRPVAAALGSPLLISAPAGAAACGGATGVTVLVEPHDLGGGTESKTGPWDWLVKNADAARGFARCRDCAISGILFIRYE